ncbi:MAG: hypothetical protein HC842_00010 [Cytophagales bacterium]|nr:hypothetical protein [Cytophagales bacterium]
MLVYEDFETTSPLPDTLDDFQGGAGSFGWRSDNYFWDVQNSNKEQPGFGLVNTKPLKYGVLLTTPIYATGGKSYQAFGRRLKEGDTPWGDANLGGFPPLQYGSQETHLWYSMLLRQDQAGQNVGFTISSSGSAFHFGIEYSNNGNRFVRVQRNASNQWELDVMGAKQSTGINIVTDVTYLMVLDLHFVNADSVHFKPVYQPRRDRRQRTCPAHGQSGLETPGWPQLGQYPILARTNAFLLPWSKPGTREYG